MNLHYPKSIAMPGAATLTRVVAPTGSLRQQYVLSRIAAQVEKNRATLLVNLNPLRDGFLHAVRGMGGSISGAGGRLAGESAGASPLHYLTATGEGATLASHPRAALDALIEQARGRGSFAKQLVIDGCQAVGPRDRPFLRSLTELALQRGCVVVAIGTAADDTLCLADIAAAPVRLPSKYDINASRINADWLLASLSWSPRPAE